MLMSTAAAVNITFTFPTKQAQLIHPFACRVNTNEEMLLQRRRQEVLEVVMCDIFRRET
jgi:hypothetical protein